MVNQGTGVTRYGSLTVYQSNSNFLNYTATAHRLNEKGERISQYYAPYAQHRRNFLAASYIAATFHELRIGNYEIVACEELESQAGNETRKVTIHADREAEVRF